MRQELICSINKMQQTHRGDRDNWGRRSGCQRKGDVGVEQGTAKKTLVTKFTSFTTLPSNSPSSPGSAQMKTICGAHLRPWWVTVHMKYFRGNLPTSVWPLAMPTLTSCSAQQKSTERSGVFHAVCLWIGREWLFILTGCSQAKCI